MQASCDDLVGPQRRDLVRGEAGRGEHRVGVGAEGRRARRGDGWRGPLRRRSGSGWRAPGLPSPSSATRLPLGDLRVVAADRPASFTGRRRRRGRGRQPAAAGFVAEDLGEPGDNRRVLVQPRGGGRAELRGSEAFAQGRPGPAVRSQATVTWRPSAQAVDVAGRESAPPGAGSLAARAMSSARTHMALSTMLASSRQARSGAPRPREGGEDADGRHRPASGSDSASPGGRRTVAEATEQTGVAEVGEVVAGRSRVRAGVAEARHRAPDQVGVLGLHGVVAEPEPVELARPVRLHDHVGPPHEPAAAPRPPGAAGGRGRGTLPTVERHVRRVEPTGRTDAAHAVSAPRRLHLTTSAPWSASSSVQKAPGAEHREVEHLTSWSGPGGASPPRCSLTGRRAAAGEARATRRAPATGPAPRGPATASRRASNTCRTPAVSAVSAISPSRPPPEEVEEDGSGMLHQQRGHECHRGALESEWPPAWPRGSGPGPRHRRASSECRRGSATTAATTAFGT